METVNAFLTPLGVEVSQGGQRRWPNRVKARIVAETLVPGATVNNVARRHDLWPNRLSAWRRMAKDGDPVLPAPEGEVEFAPLVVVDDETRPTAADADPAPAAIDIMAGSVSVRLDGAYHQARRSLWRKTHAARRLDLLGPFGGAGAR
jgi:transposase